MQPFGSAGTSWLASYEPTGDKERSDLERLSALLAVAPDPYARSSDLHITGSALILHPPSRRVLLRWHSRQHDWLQVGGHADPGETDPYVTALREAREETGLFDLVPFPDSARPAICHVVLVPVRESEDGPAHEHLDVRYLLTSSSPDVIRAENPMAPVRWSPLEVAVELAGENLAETMRRGLEALSEAPGPPGEAS